jgi:hypothetical protein
MVHEFFWLISSLDVGKVPPGRAGPPGGCLTFNSTADWPARTWDWNKKVSDKQHIDGTVGYWYLTRFEGQLRSLKPMFSF